MTHMPEHSLRRALSVGAYLVASMLALLSPADAQTIPWPGAERAALRLPDSLWNEMLGEVDHRDRRLGYSEEEMTWYGSDRHRLRSIGLLFRDVRTVTRYSGQIATQLVSAAPRAESVVRIGYSLTDVAAARFLPMPDSADLGLDGATPASPIAALRSMAGAGRFDERALSLPLPIQRLVVRLVAGTIEATPWLERALPRARLAGLSGGGLDSLYALAIAPWSEDRLGQPAVRRREAFDLPAAVDRDYLAFASAIALSHLSRALDEYRATPAGATPSLDRPLELSTPIGLVRITGVGRDTITTPAAIAIDLGGDDLWRGRHGVGSIATTPIAMVVDLGGADAYDAAAEAMAIGCGVFGIGVVADLGGDDRYRSRESALGAAWYGTGVLIDHAGDDRYDTDSLWGQGVSHVGVGALIDLAGNDVYTCAQQSQAMGSTLGAGILLDVAGNDQYIARDDGNISELYLGQSVAMSQGCGYGRRADLGDGHSLAGGYGVLVDGAGNDRYHATAWSQGCGYWWGAGFLEDLGGDDTYRNGKYSSGAGAHFAIGLQADLSGNDQYNVGNKAVMNQFQGHARDGSIGISIDGDGDDHYRLVRNCGGSADLGSIGLLWDRRGDDTYEITYAEDTTNVGWANTPALGTATSYPPSNTFRDDLDAVGIFLDGGGRDEYRWDGPAHEVVRPDNGARWRWNRDRRSWGLGLDAEIYPPRP